MHLNHSQFMKWNYFVYFIIIEIEYMYRLKNTQLRKSPRKRCLSDLESQKREEVFEEVSNQKIPNPIKDFLEEQGEFEATVRKVPRNKQSYLKIFAFQYLILCFSNKDEDGAMQYRELIYELIEKEQFEFILPQSPSELSEQSHMSLKNIISQYLNYMSDSSDSVIKSLIRYPLIMDIFVSFFKTMLYLGDICDAENDYEILEGKQGIFEFLTSYFQVEAIAIKQFIIFKDSKLSIYESSSPKQPIYMIYHDDPIYKIDDSKFSSMLNRKEEAVYKSGISSVKCLISNIDIKSHQQIESDRKEQLKSQKTCKQKSYRNSQVAIQCQDSQTQEQLKTPSIFSQKIINGSTMKEKALQEKKQNNQSNQNAIRDFQKKILNSQLGINRVITEQESMSESASFQQSSNWRKCLNNLLNMDAKNVSYSLAEQSSSKLVDQSKQRADHNKEKKTKQKSMFSLLKENIIPEYLQDYQKSPIIIQANKKSKKRVQSSSPPESSNHVHSIIDKYQFEEFNFSSKNIIASKFKSPKQSLQNSIVNENKAPVQPQKDKKFKFFMPEYYIPSSHNKTTHSTNKLSVKETTKVKWNANLNITKQFTSSIILQAINQPCRTAIRNVKNKARHQRKNAKKFIS